MRALSVYNPKEYKVIIMDNAGFHSLKGIEIPENISIINIPAYSPELNLCEQIWQYIKHRFKDKAFETMGDLKSWLYDQVNEMSKELVMSITSNHHYLKIFTPLLE